MAQNLEQLPGLKEGQQVITPIGQPIKATGHLQVLPQTFPEPVPTVLRVCSGLAEGGAAGHHGRRRSGNGHRPPCRCVLSISLRSSYISLPKHPPPWYAASLAPLFGAASCRVQPNVLLIPQPRPPAGIAPQQAGRRMRDLSVMLRVTLAARSAAGMHLRSASQKARGVHCKGLSILQWCSP